MEKLEKIQESSPAHNSKSSSNMCSWNQMREYVLRSRLSKSSVTLLPYCTSPTMYRTVGQDMPCGGSGAFLGVFSWERRKVCWLVEIDNFGVCD